MTISMQANTRAKIINQNRINTGSINKVNDREQTCPVGTQGNTFFSR